MTNFIDEAKKVDEQKEKNKEKIESIKNELCKTEFYIATTRFIVLPLNAFFAYQLLEFIRERIGFNLLSVDTNALASNLASVVATNVSNMEHVRKKLFNNVNYFLADSNEGKMMKTDADVIQAFQQGCAGDIYELLLRCVYINFFSTFDKALKAAKLLPQDTSS